MKKEIRKIVWISRHELNKKNKEILTRAFGEWEIAEWVRETVTAEDLKELTEKHKDAMFVVVLPPQLIAELLKFTPNVYRFTVERTVAEHGNVVFTPVGLEKIIRIEIVTERVI
jgi:hypothetical protein